MGAWVLIIESWYYCSATATRRIPSRQFAENLSHAAVLSKLGSTEGTAPSSSVAPPRLVVVTRAHRPGEPNPQDSSAPIEANTRQSGHNQTRSSAWNAPTWPSPGHHGDDTNILRLVDRRRLLAGGDDRQRPRIVRGRGHLRAISASTGHGCGKYSLPN
jgi:hypothetical protein